MFETITSPVRSYLKWRNAEFFSLYQVGKIGGASLYGALQDAGFKVEHTHNFRSYSTGASDLQSRIESLRPSIFKTYRNEIRRKLLKLFSRLGLKHRNKSIKIITGIREPMAMNISRFFQDFSAFTLDHLNGYSTGQSKWPELNQGCVFVENAFNTVVKHDYPTTWFEREFKHVTGVDIYKYEFDKTRGWSIIRSGKYEIFLYRFENLFDRELLAALNDFIGTEINLGNRNAGEKRWYSDVYKTFKGHYRPSKSLLDRLYQSRCIQHFYSDEEIEDFYKKYS